MLSRYRLVFMATIIAFICFFLSLSKGSTSASFQQLLFDNFQQFHTIIWQLRLPRTVTAFVCGGLLALAGSLIQLLLRNPLADPYVLGVSGGAALFTLLMMLLGFSESWLMGGAWLGSLVAILIMIALTRKHQFQTHTLLLTGIALACGFSAGISCILIISPDANLHSMLFWLSGDLNNTYMPWLGMLILIVGFVCCMLLAPGLNILGRGEKEARALGLASHYYHIALFLLSSLFTACAVTLAGCIGFIGLIIPHMTRFIAGYDHRITLPISMLLGGSLLMLADMLARTLIAPQQIPVGILMALIGVPVFVCLLVRGR